MCGLVQCVILFRVSRASHVLLMCNRRGILLVKSSLYLSSKFVGKFSGNVVVGVRLIVEGVEGSDRVSVSEKDVLDEISIGSLTNLAHLE